LFRAYLARLLGGADISHFVVANGGKNELDIRPAGSVEFFGGHLAGLSVEVDPGPDLCGDVAAELVDRLQQTSGERDQFRVSGRRCVEP